MDCLAKPHLLFFTRVVTERDCEEYQRVWTDLPRNITALTVLAKVALPVGKSSTLLF